MTGPRLQGRLDQVFFGWSQHHGRQWVLADSFDNRDEHTRWQHRLQSHIRLQRLADAALPDAALSYFPFPEGKAVLLRRVNAGVSAGRNNSHALIGPSDLLTPRAALGLGYWKGWRADPPVAPLEPLSAQLIVEAARAADNRLLPGAAANTATLMSILAGLLGDPRNPISVIGCPDDLKPAMIWALIEIAERTRMGLGDRSFSTYETRHDVGVERAPHILFLPVRPYERAEVSRTIVDLDRPIASGPQVQPAQLLCQQLVSRTLAPPATDRPAPRDDATRLIGPPQSRTVPVSPASPASSVSPVSPVSPVPPVSLVSLVSPVSSVSPVSPEEALVAVLRAARTLHDFDRTLAKLQRRPREQRGRVRSALDAAALDAAAFQVEVTFREELLRRLLEAAYGPEFEDLADPQVQKHAVEVVRDGGSEQLAMIIGTADAAARGPIPAAAFQRWTAAARSARSEPAARLVRRMRASRRSRYLPLAAAAAVLAIMGVAFLGGVLLGRAGGDGRAVAASPQPVPAPVAVPSGRIAGGFITIDGVNQADVTVVAFARAAGQTLRVQGPCLAASGTIWFCPSRGDLPPAQNAALVAYAMPKKQADSVLKEQAPRAPAADWGAAHEVR